MGRIPKLGWHKGQGRWYLTDPRTGKEVYLSRKTTRTDPPPKQVQGRYRAWVEEFLTTKEPAVVGRNPTVNELWLAYLLWCQSYYRKGGRQTSEVAVIRTACRVVARLFGETRVRQFGPVELERVRQEMIRLGWVRRSINKQINRVRGMFRWGVAHDHVPVEVLTRLRTVGPLKRGRTEAVEKRTRGAVSWEAIERALPFLAEPLPDLIRAHYLIGCRAAEIVAMRPGDIDRTGPCWLWIPEGAKTEHLDLVTRYWIGPQAQAILAPYLLRCGDGTVFQVGRKKGNGRRSGAYTTASYRRAVTRASERAKGERWTPHQLRHAKATLVRKEYGAEGAQAVLGHRHLSTTEIYAARSDALAQKIQQATG